MGAKQSNPLYPSRALRADPSADDSMSYESAVPELPAVAVSREPEASINSDLAGNDAICSTCPSRPSP